MQDSNAATTATGAGGRQEPGTDRTTTTRVSSSAGVTPPPPPRPSSFPFFPSSSFFRSRFRSPDLHLELLRDPSYKTRIHFYPFPILILAHVPQLQSIYILTEVAKFPNSDAPRVPGSGCNWILGAVAYIPCRVLSIFGVFLRYEVLYSYYRRWCFCRPLILPIYLSSPAFNFVAMSSYDHSYFLQHIRSSAFPYSSANLPTIMTLLPRAGLPVVLALLLSFSSPENLPGGLPLSDVDQSIARRDGTFFYKNAGALSAYANAAWAASCPAAGIAVWGSMGLAHAGRRKRLVMQLRSKVKSRNRAWSQLWVPAAPMHLPGAGKNVLSYAEKSAERPSEDEFEGIEKVFAAVGLGGTAQPQPVCGGMLSRDLFGSPNGAYSRRNSAPNGHANGQEVITPPPEALVHEKSTSEGRTHRSRISRIPSLAFDHGTAANKSRLRSRRRSPYRKGVQERLRMWEKPEEEEEKYINLRSSEEPSSSFGRASKSLSSLGQRPAYSQPLPIRISSPGPRGQHVIHSLASLRLLACHCDTTKQEDVHGMPMPPRHPVARGSRQHPSATPGPVSPTPAGITATRPRQTFEEHRRQLRQSIGSEALQESDREDNRASRSGQPSPDGSLEARECEDSFDPRVDQPRFPLPLSEYELGLGLSALLALGCARAHSLIQNIGGASQSSIELVLGRMPQLNSPPVTGAVRLGDTSDIDGSEGALSNPESHLFGLPVVGGAGSLLQRRAGVRAHTLEGDPGRSSVSVSSSSSAAAATAVVAAAMSARARSVRGQAVSPEPRSSSLCARSSDSLSSERERQGTLGPPSRRFLLDPPPVLQPPRAQYNVNQIRRTTLQPNN
ncbi:hypothetical protein F5888DRAFT_1906591 [Russula emetica]|nr:hypothetical protein F5888DRAFT_1906591 [Russula emetica]